MSWQRQPSFELCRPQINWNTHNFIFYHPSRRTNSHDWYVIGKTQLEPRRWGLIFLEFKCFISVTVSKYYILEDTWNIYWDIYVAGVGQSANSLLVSSHNKGPQIDSQIVRQAVSEEGEEKEEEEIVVKTLSISILPFFLNHMLLDCKRLNSEC